jgi:hypothetical protein
MMMPRSEPGAGGVRASCLVDGAIQLDRCACQRRHAFWPGRWCGGHDRARLQRYARYRLGVEHLKLHRRDDPALIHKFLQYAVRGDCGRRGWAGMGLLLGLLGKL